jgi:dihydroorotate dehydrogenase
VTKSDRKALWYRLADRGLLRAFGFPEDLVDAVVREIDRAVRRERERVASMAKDKADRAWKRFDRETVQMIAQAKGRRA